MQLYLVMITCNCLKYTLQTVESIATKLPFSFVIIENASTDETPKWLEGYINATRDLHPKDRTIIPIRHLTRISVAQAWNEGLKMAMMDPEFEYAIILNNDVVLEPNYVDRIVKFHLDHPDYYAITGLDTHNFQKQEGHVEDGKISFGATLMTKACLQKVGYFDEQFVQAYFEDNDYHERLRQAGNKCCLVCDICFYHHGSRWLNEGASPSERTKHDDNFRNNREYFLRKWGHLPT
jgi:GT2 family glycosyltransferase